MKNIVKSGRKLIYITILLTIAFIFFTQNIRESRRIKNQETAQVQRGTLEEKLTISGAIDAEQKVVLRFQTLGRLVWVGVQEGDYLKKYQGIASLDKRELTKRLEKELNDYLKTRADFDQVTQDDYKDKVITDAIKRIKDKSQLDLNNAVLDVEIASIVNEYATISTPIEGLVTRVDAPYAGINIIPQEAEFEIVNPKTIYFLAGADQTEVVKVNNDKNGTLILDAYEDEEFKGKIKNISFKPSEEETGAVYKLKFVFDADNSTYKYRVGMAGDLTFVTDSRPNVLYLPIKFVKVENGKSLVKVRKKGKETKAEVTTGMKTDNLVEIKSGVSEGETVYD